MIVHSSASPKSYLFGSLISFVLNPLVALPDASVSAGPYTRQFDNRRSSVSSLNDLRRSGHLMTSSRRRASRFCLPESARAATPLPGRRLELCLGSWQLSKKSLL